MLTTFKLKILHRLLGWFLGFYDPHHDLEARTHIDFTRGQVYLFIRDKWRMKKNRQTWYCNGDNHDRNCLHQLEVHAEIDKVVAVGPPTKKRTILNIKPR